ncbi:Por secretion system C-terminal sorting domain-containing protein [Formosa sp. Hel1_31_208]|uniref:lipocalin-like domain-containing protein n=1 Tax=Formosa sp. Hel1_31_208 TaxID=1798225 RepID=UPI00087D2FA2|nr:lipocalin-like domain-containing protein [Formosa sp. Hel1_31_208]SDS67306.1 Por secretion system C-terminal sorting domain-containing protein [Formosa sp. Hel1_31_208]
MKLKINLAILFWIISYVAFAQEWKTYPYNPSGQIAFPTDEGRHSAEPIEWWYSAGHVIGQTTGKSYSFMYTFFHYPQSGFDGFRILNITDDDTGTFLQDVKPLNYTTLSTTSFDIEATVLFAGVESWRNKEDIDNIPIPFEYELFAATTNAGLDIEFETLKRPLILGDDGLLDQGATNYTYYFSQTMNAVTGSLTFNGNTETVIGTAWIDRQYGNFNPLTGEKYEWFSMQLSNGIDINLWNIFTENGLVPNTDQYRILSAYVDENTQYTNSDFQIERLAFNCMPDGERCYSKQWRLTSVVNNLDLTISTLHDNTEVLLPFRFYEGATSITGTVNGIAVTGVGFAELLHDYNAPEITFSSPISGIYDPSFPITWELDNPDDGRPVFYDIEYSDDILNTFNTVATNLTSPSYLWENPPLSDGDDVWFRITARSIDGVLSTATLSPVATLATLSLNDLNINQIKTYPNPVKDVLTVNIGQPIIGSYTIIDMKGSLIKTSEIDKLQFLDISTTTLESGVYILAIEASIGTFNVRFVKL